MNEQNFWCDKCGEKITLEMESRDKAREKMKREGWRVDIGIRRGMVLGIWTCPDCLKSGSAVDV
ncbi:MAG: hypothetical protein LBD29_04015 [Treponema sp.]|jgi:hypothetical protein|nr:hypothetical protein [Treponema sp.]